MAGEHGTPTFPAGPATVAVLHHRKCADFSVFFRGGWQVQLNLQGRSTRRIHHWQGALGGKSSHLLSGLLWVRGSLPFGTSLGFKKWKLTWCWSERVVFMDLCRPARRMSRKRRRWRRRKQRGMRLAKSTLSSRPWSLWKESRANTWWILSWWFTSWFWPPLVLSWLTLTALDYWQQIFSIEKEFLHPNQLFA